MPKRLFYLFILSTAILAGQPKPIASYRIDATLDANAKSVEASEILTWTNDSGDAIPELQFHLYMNAFKNEASTFYRETGRSSRGFSAWKDSWGWIDIKKLQLLGGSDLTKSIQFIHPDDDNAEDRTVIRVPLSNPVAAGATIQLRIDFHTQFPHVFARAGYHGTFLLAGQWFPKIGVYEKAGERDATKGQWNCHQYHATSEFYADFGTYDVKLKVPSNEVVGATGVLENQQRMGETTQYSFHQDNVHDFAWTAQPTFIKVERTFHADAEVTPAEIAETAARFGISPSEARLTDVQMILLIQPEHASQIDRHFRAIRNAIKYFGLWYGRYPHKTITVVDPPRGAGGAGGMEYPTFITAETNWLVSDIENDPEEVIVHEFGHQYWQGLVATNEFEEAWMDEGFNTYSTGKVIDKVYGPGAVPLRVLGTPIDWFTSVPTYTQDQFNRGIYLLAPKTDVLARNAWQYQNVTSYGINSYMRTGATLRTLENYLGEDKMARVMRTYYDRWHYAHPDARDFFRVVNEVAGQDMTWFFDQTFLGSNTLDYRVAEVSSEPVEKFAGIFDGKQQPKKKDEKGKKPKQFESKVIIRREGEVIMPVEIKIVLDDGKVLWKHWDGQYRWVKYTVTGPQRIASVEIDPNHKILLDTNFSNNSYVVGAIPGATLKWSSTLLFWVQQALQLVGGLS